MDDVMETPAGSPERVAWLREVKRRFPVGCRVRVIGSDVDEYVGATGTVDGYDLGSSGVLPLVEVMFDAPVEHHGRARKRDGFFDDELERLDAPSVKSSVGNVLGRILSRVGVERGDAGGYRYRGRRVRFDIDPRGAGLVLTFDRFTVEAAFNLNHDGTRDFSLKFYDEGKSE